MLLKNEQIYALLNNRPWKLPEKSLESVICISIPIRKSLM